MLPVFYFNNDDTAFDGTPLIDDRQMSLLFIKKGSFYDREVSRQR
jgi:hypothetical protein